MNRGELIAGRFVIERLAGEGGMATVYRALDRETNAPVAIKLVDLRDAPRFAREVAALAELQHPAIVRYIAHGSAADGSLFLAMEWLEGEDLSVRLRDGRRLGTAESLVVARRVAEALSFAHARGVVHRDIKPSNIFLPEGILERAKLLDFGVARLTGRSGPPATRIGTTVGTPGYMAPEQARGDTTLDGRADLFALGCVLFECLTGREAFAGDDVMELLAKIILAQVPRMSALLPDVLPALDDLVSRLLSKEPADRPASAEALIAELDALAAAPSGARPPHTSERRRLTDAEQRYVSMLLAAPPPLRGAPASTLSPEQLQATDVLLSEKVRAFGARFERLRDGSAVAALLGTGTAMDQAVQAARCALVLRQELPAVPVVLATGRGIVDGNLPVGEVIERAASIMRAVRAERAPPSDPRAVRVDEVTARLLRDQFDVRSDDLGFSLFAEKREIDSVRSLLGRASPFVGREPEIEKLDAIFDVCTADRVAKALLVTAPAGAGKSRLLREWLGSAESRASGLRVLMSRGDPMSAGSPFGMLGRLLRHALGILENQSLLERQQRLAEQVGALLPGADAQRVTEFLGEIVGAPFADTWSDPLRAARQNAILMGDQMRLAWEDWLGAQCAVHPVLIVLEDLHWGDLPTVQFVDSVLRLHRSRPLMVLALARPEVKETFPALWADRGVEELALGPLSREACDRFARDMLGDSGLAPAALRRLAERSGGNAFFLEELIRAAAEGSVDALPETVLAMAQARVERLEPEVRRALRAASVFGEVFWAGSVTALLGGTARGSMVADSLGEAVVREIIVRRPDARFAGEEEFAFRHTVVREAVYGMLTERDRVVAHALAGKWLEQAGEADALALAEHFERGGEPSRAVTWYRRSAEQALEGNDLDAAIMRAERGIACGAAGEVRGGLRLVECEARTWRGDFREAQAAARDAMACLTPAGPAWYTAVAELARACGRLGHTGKLVDIAEVLNAWEPQEDGRNECAVAAATAAVALYHAGRFDLGARLLDRAEALGATSSTARAWSQRGRATQALLAGDVEAHVAALTESAASFEAAGDLRNACFQRANIGYAEIDLGAYARAEGWLREALEAAERLGLRSLAMSTKTSLGVALLRQGELGEACTVLREATAFFEALGDRRLEGTARTHLAKALTEGGELELAEREATAAAEVLQAMPPLRVSALAALAHIRLARGRPADAMPCARQAYVLLESLGGVGVADAAVRLAYAEVLAASGNADGARDAITVARDRLLMRAERIREPAWRASFLGVPDHARTLARAREWIDADLAASTVG